MRDLSLKNKLKVNDINRIVKKPLKKKGIIKRVKFIKTGKSQSRLKKVRKIKKKLRKIKRIKRVSFLFKFKNEFYKYRNLFVNNIMFNGKKQLAFNFYKNFIFFLKKSKLLKRRKNVELFLFAFFESRRPVIGFVSRKVGAKVYKLAQPINKFKSRSLLIKWFLSSARSRSEKDFNIRLQEEFLDFFFKRGKTFRKLEEFYALAFKNRPYMKYLYYNKKGRKKFFMKK